MSEETDATTSESLADTLNTNPVVFRRTMAGLRDAGIVRSEKGHGGGWSLARPLRAVMLADVYRALGLVQPFSIGQRDTTPECVLEQAVNRVIGEALREAEAALVARLRSLSVADVLADTRRMKPRPASRRSKAHA